MISQKFSYIFDFSCFPFFDWPDHSEIASDTPDLNCVSIKKPENRPILIIRELINFHPDTLHECLQAMEKAKEGEVYLQIILETSDNLWSEMLAFKRSGLSFSPYYMQEMSYKEV